MGLGGQHEKFHFITGFGAQSFRNIADILKVQMTISVSYRTKWVIFITTKQIKGQKQRKTAHLVKLCVKEEGCTSQQPRQEENTITAAIVWNSWWKFPVQDGNFQNANQVLWRCDQI